MSDKIEVGKLIEGAAYRDAVHFALAPVTACCRMNPGETIKLTGDGDEVIATDEGDHIGIVDPFLTKAIKPKDRFYMFLLPNTVTGMRHEWQHPAFRDGDVLITKEDRECESELFIKRIAAVCGISYEKLIDDAKAFIEGNGYQWIMKAHPDGGEFSSEDYKDCYEEWPIFWIHFERVTGLSVDKEFRECPYTCSC